MGMLMGFGVGAIYSGGSILIIVFWLVVVMSLWGLAGYIAPRFLIELFKFIVGAMALGWLFS